MSMRVTVPAWYQDFHCIADACTDSCCIGWEIDIDEETMARYRRMGGAFGERLRAHIDETGDVPHFILNGERCPFLNERGLCDLILEAGEENLCQICDRHPRFYEWFGDETEIGLGMCCEEACRLLLTTDKPFEVISYETDEEADDRDFDPEVLEALRAVRERMFALLSGEHLSLGERLALVLNLAEDTQDALDSMDTEALPALADSYGEADIDQTVLLQLKMIAQEAGRPEAGALTEIVELFASFEPIHPDWPEKLRMLADSTERMTLQGVESERKEALAHVAGYFLYRYLLKAVFDGDVLSPVRMAIVSVLLIAGLEAQEQAKTGGWTLKDRIDLLKMYSQELEYDPENIETLYEAGDELDGMRFESLLGLLLE